VSTSSTTKHSISRINRSSTLEGKSFIFGLFRVNCPHVDLTGNLESQDDAGSGRPGGPIAATLSEMVGKSFRKAVGRTRDIASREIFPSTPANAYRKSTQNVRRE